MYFLSIIFFSSFFLLLFPFWLSSQQLFKETAR